MLYELGNGKTVNLTFEQWNDLTDEKIQDLIAGGSGREINDPFIKISDREFKKFEIPELEIEDIPETEIKNIEDEFNIDPDFED